MFALMQNTEWKSAELPSRNPPNCQKKLRQIAKQKSAKLPSQLILLVLLCQELQQPHEISRQAHNFAVFLVIFCVKQDFLVAGAQEKNIVIWLIFAESQNFFRSKPHFPQNFDFMQDCFHKLPWLVLYLRRKREYLQKLKKKTWHSKISDYLVACQSGNNSVVECYLAKVDVAGPNPVSRSIFLCPFSIEILWLAP